MIKNAHFGYIEEQIYLIKKTMKKINQLRRNKMARFQVMYLITDWVGTEVIAKDENEAREKVDKLIRKLDYRNSIFESIDGKTQFVGTTNLDLVDKLND